MSKTGSKGNAPKPSNETTVNQGQAAPNNPQMESARNALSKLPILGPAVWLYARDASKRFTFIGDIDWTILPPVILDQCRLYTRDGIPFAFITWALLSDEIDKRFRSGEARIAPHEWQTGENIWLIDVIAPFGEGDKILDEFLKIQFEGKKVTAFRPDPTKTSQPVIKEWKVGK